MELPTNAEQRKRALEMDADCYQKARAKGEQTFTVREQDNSAPEVICFWIQRNIRTASKQKLVDALLDAIVMRDNDLGLPRKDAD